MSEYDQPREPSRFGPDGFSVGAALGQAYGDAENLRVLGSYAAGYLVASLVPLGAAVAVIGGAAIYLLSGLSVDPDTGPAAWLALLPFLGLAVLVLGAVAIFGFVIASMFESACLRWMVVRERVGGVLGLR